MPLVWERPFGDDLSAILKYTGKTNALFTRLLLHIAELFPARRAGADRPLRLLDPVAGKGTTLFEALMRGWDACGIEIVQKAAHEGAVYFQKYLETGRWKHTLQKEKAHGAPAWRFAFARDKDALAAATGPVDPHCGRRPPWRTNTSARAALTCWPETCPTAWRTAPSPAVRSPARPRPCFPGRFPPGTRCCARAACWR